MSGDIEREERRRRLTRYSDRVQHPQFPPQQPKPAIEGEPSKMKVKKGMTNKAGEQQPLICIPIDVYKGKRKKSGVLDKDDKDDLYRAFGTTGAGVSKVDERDYFYNDGQWY